MKKHLLTFALLWLLSGAMFGQDEFTINVSANPPNGGSVTGDGTYNYGDSCTLTATPATGYAFYRWKKGTGVIYANPYTFTVTGSASYVAHFRQLPTVTTDSVTNITQTTVTCGGNVTSGGDTPVTARGVCWSTSHNPTISNSHTTDGTGTGSFTSSITGLTANTTYYVRAYATNSAGTTYGNEVSFIIQVPSYTIAVSANPTDGGTVTGGGTYQQGQSCTVSATPATCYHFVNWTENGNTVSTNFNYTFTVTGNRNLVAHFAKDQHLISVSANPTEGGTVSGGATYYCGDSCTVMATPNGNYEFSNWTENGEEVSTEAVYTFMVTRPCTLVAQFQAQYTISVSANPTNGGTVNGGGTYNQGQSCTVTASPSAGFTFTNWTENGSVVSTQANYTFTVNDNRNLVANFQAQTQNYTISVSANPSNGGSVHVGSPTGPATGTFTQGQSCTVYATVNSGFTFTNWTENGNVVSTQANYTFNVTSNRTLVANFQPQNYTISVSANPSNGGSVHVGSPTGPTTGTFTQGQSCTVYATVNSGFTFTNWTENGTSVSTNAKYPFTVNDNRNLVANFTHTYTISVSANPPEGGTVTGGGQYDAGANCTLTATHASGYEFIHWKKGNNVVSNNATYNFSVTENATYTAKFEKVYTITVNANNDEWGTVSGGGIFPADTTITITATAYGGFTFVKWQDGETNNPRQITVTENATYTATFTPNTYTIRVLANPQEGGTVYIGDSPSTNEQSFTFGNTCTVHAIPNQGFDFVNWTKNGTQVSSNATYTFSVTESGTYVGHFQIQSYTISVNANPTNGGTVTGGGSYNYGVSCTVTATANTGYDFVNWTENGTPVSTDTTYTFNVTGYRTLTANFEQQFYTIKATIEGSGSITPKGDVRVEKGSDTTFYIKPDFGFRIESVIVDDDPDMVQDTISFHDVNCDHTIHVLFSGWNIEEYDAKEIKVYPNPAKEMVFVEGDGLAVVSLYDLLGNCLRSADCETSHEMSLSDVTSGAYVLMIKTKDGHIGYQKLMVAK